MSTCDNCHYELSDHVTACEHCGKPCFPNVNIANKAEEKQVINNNYDITFSMAKDEIKPILKKFENAVNNSNAILVRPFNEVLTLFMDSKNLHQTFHQRLRSGAIHIDENGYDEHRPSVDAKLFPNYSDRITFAALSLNSLGATGYGGCHMTLKTVMIAHRSTVFKGNSFHILRDESISVANEVPKGLRTTWELRGKLAISKLAPCFVATTTGADFQEILINDNDFIEVHVFGSISHRTIGEIVVQSDKLDDIEKHVAQAIKQKIQSWERSIPDWDTKFTEL